MFFVHCHLLPFFCFSLEVSSMIMITIGILIQHKSFSYKVQVHMGHTRQGIYILAQVYIIKCTRNFELLLNFKVFSFRMAEHSTQLEVITKELNQLEGESQFSARGSRSRNGINTWWTRRISSKNSFPFLTSFLALVVLLVNNKKMKCSAGHSMQCTRGGGTHKKMMKICAELKPCMHGWHMHE